MKPKYLPEITGEDVVKFLEEDAKPITRAQQKHIEECREKYDRYFTQKR